MTQFDITPGGFSSAATTTSAQKTHRANVPASASLDEATSATAAISA